MEESEEISGDPGDIWSTNREMRMRDDQHIQGGTGESETDTGTSVKDPVTSMETRKVSRRYSTVDILFLLLGVSKLTSNPPRIPSGLISPRSLSRTIALKYRGAASRG
jgi:hypothetical protein